MDLETAEKLMAIALLLPSIAILRIAVEKGDMDDAMDACMTLAAVVLVALLLWFILDGPTPDYLPEYGSDPCDIPAQMKD